MDLQKLVIDNIKRIRKEKGFTQEKLAEACNTATSYIGLMEIYQNTPKLDTIERIAAALDVNPLVFFREYDNLPEEKEEELQKIKERILKSVNKEIDSALRAFIG
ncbi:MAG: helix-turn-helix domain-containing protein [Treponema sp.]|jgi:transcriptional regulator with XRE-family HTH domain|nr:helix-turn-helix domain-containing protein [Treponema sp.]